MVTTYARWVTTVFWPERDTSEQLTQFVVYDHPKDYPEGFVVRQWIIQRGSDPIAGQAVGGPTLESVRAAIPRDKVRLERDPSDDPSIFETWI